MIAALERGDRTTRVESFVDAAFAFALTLLVIAGDRIPTSVAELVDAFKGLPACALGFLLILKFWTAHVNWSRRYGLDDGWTRRLSLLLVFLVLVFVYPMKMVFDALCSAVTGGWLPAGFTISSLEQLPMLFIAFGLAFGTLGVVMLLLYAHAWRLREQVGLSAVERLQTRYDLASWALVPSVAAVSITSALLIPPTDASGWWLGFPGFIYLTLNLATPLLAWHCRRRVARMPA